MNEHDFDARLRTWARSTSVRPAPAALRRRVQGIPTIERTNQLVGGTRTMLSATKVLGIAAVVALFGVVVVAVPFATRDQSAPAAPPSERGDVSMYAGTMRIPGLDEAGTNEVFEWGALNEGERWTTELEMDDPRMSGVSSCYSNVFVTDRGAGWLGTQNCRTVNEDGAWQVIGRGYGAPNNGGVHVQQRLVGEGGFEGLYALQRCDRSAAVAYFECEGAVFRGDLPATPAEAPESLPEYAPPYYP